MSETSGGEPRPTTWVPEAAVQHAIKRAEPRRIRSSILSALSKCGVLAYMDYVEERPRRRAGPPAARGTGAHEAVKANLTSKMATGRLLDVEQVVAIARDKVQEQFDEHRVHLQRNGPPRAKVIEDTKRAAMHAAMAHHLELAPTIEPLEVEQRFALEVTGHDLLLTGQVDYREAAAIGDTKTTTRAPAPDAAANSIQLDLYALAAARAGVPVERVRLDFVKVGDDGRAKETTRREAPVKRSSEALLRRVEAAARVLEAGAFMPADPGGPAGWICTERWCHRFEECPFGRRRRVQG